MKTNKLNKFAIFYLLSLLIGNLVVYIVDRISTNFGLNSMNVWNYLILNIVIIFIAYLAYHFTPNKRKN